MTDELLEQKFGSKNFKDIKELNLSNCKLWDFEDMFDEIKFPSLRELDLSFNLLVTLWGFRSIPKLQILLLNSNKLETLMIVQDDT